mgnify:CR=1 FL=1
MKKKITNILFGLMFLIGLGVLLYPTISNQWNTYRQNRLISDYEETLEGLEIEDFSVEWEKAKTSREYLKNASDKRHEKIKDFNEYQLISQSFIIKFA